MKLSNRYRIVRDSYLGFKVQIKRWWFPFWCQIWYRTRSNTSSSIERAEYAARWHAAGNRYVKPSRVVCYLTDKDLA